MDASKLRERLRSIVRPDPPVHPELTAGADATAGSDHSRTAPFVERSEAIPLKRNRTDRAADLEAVLGGEWRESPAGRCFIVERRIGADTLHGCAPVGTFADEISGAFGAAPLLANGVGARPPLVFFDLETTGLSGGAGTYAFLIGCGWFDDDGAFVTHQYVLTRIAEERPVLRTLAEALAQAGALVSFNGRTFDAPVLETRYLYHRLAFPASAVPHLDMLHPARRFWSNRAYDGSTSARVAAVNPPFGADVRFRVRRDALAHVRVRLEAPADPRARPIASCSLGALEQHVLGASRADDVPGFEIPARYFQYLRSGNARPLAPVLEHNRLDLLSLAGITARLLSLVDRGCGCARHAGEALALGGVYARAGLDDRAERAYQHAVALTDTDRGCRWIRIDALRALALAARRQRRYVDAARWWHELLTTRGCPREIVREASEALAIHHEHRLRDLANARAFALRLLDEPARPAWTDAVRHRLARIERKMGLLDL